jgi:MoaA/NifB/PqqE/SkfB family radical SAM enzyme
VLRRPPGISRPETPTELIFFVTDRCNARCGHCFYRYAIDAGAGSARTDRLGLAQIERIIRSLREPLHSLVLTGGEPFLRRDLADICALFCTLRRPDLIVLPTNGLLTEQIPAQIERICAAGAPHLLVQVSLDGLAGTHDAIRGQEGSFERAVATATALHGMQETHHHLDVTIATTISRRNLAELEALAAYVHEDLALPHSFEVVRGTRSPLLTSLAPDLASPAHPLDPGSQPLSPDELSALYPRLERIYRRNTHLVTGGHALWTPLAYAYRIRRYWHLVDVVRRRRPFRCPAGRQVGVLYPDGDVAMCELSRPIGNLDAVGYDLHALWNSETAQAMRARLARCFCTHGCFQTVAMAREPAMVGRMALSALDYVAGGRR